MKNIPKEIVDTLTKIHLFIEMNKNKNYMIRFLDREVPNLEGLVEKLHNIDTIETECKYKDSCGHDICNLTECDEFE